MRTKILAHGDQVCVRCDGWIAFQPRESRFAVGEEVKATHPAGPVVYVRKVDERRGAPELWRASVMYWWHPPTAAGRSAKALRDEDRSRYPEVYGPGAAAQYREMYHDKFPDEAG